jgi:hypothetical protein
MARDRVVSCSSRNNCFSGTSFIGLLPPKYIFADPNMNSIGFGIEFALAIRTLLELEGGGACEFEYGL